jgi:predicted membrane protein
MSYVTSEMLLWICLFSIGFLFGFGVTTGFIYWSINKMEKNIKKELEKKDA